jgi:hypothetical protein
MDQAFAQTSPLDKGSMIISGNFRFYSQGGDLYSRGDEARTTFIEFDPAASYFVLPGLALGLRLQYNHGIRGDHSTITWGAGPEINYFFGSDKEDSNVQGNTYPFLQGGFFYSNLSYDSFSGSGDMITRMYTTSRFGTGVAYLISNSVALSSLLAYDIDTMKHEDLETETGNQYGIYVGFLIFLY